MKRYDSSIILRSPLRPSAGPGRSLRRASERRSGIALMVVMIVFIVLYMVVYHLHFYTKMEERVAKVRYGDIQALDALQSVAQYVVALLIEDLVQDYAEAGDAAAAGGGAPAGGGPPAAGGAGAGRDPGAGGSFAPIPGAAGAGGPAGGAGAATATATHIDYLHENIFLPNTQTISDIEVKVRLWDNEGRLDLNRIFRYAPLPDVDGVRAADGSIVSADDLTDTVLGSADDESAAANLRSRILAGTSAGSRRSADGTEDAEGVAGEDGEGALDSVAGLEDESELQEWVEPTAEERVATLDLLTRAIEVVLSMNEDNGYYYQDTYSSASIADEIVYFVTERRRDPVQNRIYDVTELLNLDQVTEELFYGPTLAIPKEGFETGDGLFLLKRDSFGDLVGEFIADEQYAYEREQQEAQLSQLKEQFGAFMDFPGLGGLDGNALTRGMTQKPQVMNEDGSEELLEPPLPIGLRDIFTTFSSGKININTAPIPVLYALLPSLSEGPDGEANQVAVGVHLYRNRLQDYEEDAEVNPADPTMKNLGQPRRPLPTEEEEEALADPNNVEALLGYAPDGSYVGGSSYEDVEANYFTNLQQIELIDGTDESADDLLRSDVGIDRVSAEDDSLLQRVLNDYGKVMVFGSTYFTIELKAKAPGSPLVKSGTLIVKRDPQKKMLEVLLWKEQQK